MFFTGYEEALMPRWAVVLAIVALSPVPLALPSGVALAAIGLTGSAVLLLRLRQCAQPALVSPRTAVPQGLADGRA
jgi:hypothetical protein